MSIEGTRQKRGNSECGGTRTSELLRINGTLCEELRSSSVLVLFPYLFFSLIQVLTVKGFFPTPSNVNAELDCWFQPI